MKRGQIYYLDSVPPLHGGPLKDRRVVIVTETEDIILDNPIFVVVCTGTLLNPSEGVALPYHARKGVACTSFTKPTWAIPAWLLEIRPSQLREYCGYVPTDKLREIAARLPRPPQPPDGPKD